MEYVMNMKWKSRVNGRIIEVLGDEKINNRPYRFYVWEDDPTQAVLQWDMIYGEIWDNHFTPLDILSES